MTSHCLVVAQPSRSEGLDLTPHEQACLQSSEKPLHQFLVSPEVKTDEELQSYYECLKKIYEIGKPLARQVGAHLQIKLDVLFQVFKIFNEFGKACLVPTAQEDSSAHADEAASFGGYNGS